MPSPLLKVPEVSSHTDWRIPRPSDRYDRMTAKVPHNGEWHVVRKAAGMTVCEQAARSLNVSTDSPWEWGYRVYALDGELVSDLAVRWIGGRK